MMKLSKLVVGVILLAMSASALPAQATVTTITNQEVSGIKIADRGHGHHGDNDRDDYYEGNRGVRRGWYKNKKKKHHSKYYSNGANNANTRYGTPVIYVPQQPQVIYTPQQTCVNTRFGRRCQ
jgi:hypothetical protein